MKPYIFIANLGVALLAGFTLAACEDDGPTGSECQPEEQGQSLSCGLGKKAYCGYMDGSDAFEYGPCLGHKEIECEPGEWRENNDDYNCQSLCVVVGGEPMWQVQNNTCDTPLVLSFDAAPVEMIAAESTPMATFDISMRPDSCITTDWPTAATPWLVVDLDGNGRIDGGHELFGSGSRLADGRQAAHGFAALAEFDADASGVVDGNDPRFGELMLWRDWDADRFSTPDELSPLLHDGVSALPVDFEIEVSCDERGNCGVQRASFEHAAGHGQIVDMYLACQ